MLGVGCRAIAAAGSIDCSGRRPLCDIATMQEDAGVDDAESKEHQSRPEDRPLHAFAEAALIAGPDLHWSELWQLGADVGRDQGNHDPSHCDRAGEQNRILC